MNGDKPYPQTLQEAILHFADKQVAFEFMKNVRWPDGVVKCPQCGTARVSFLSTRKMWTCLECKTRRQFTLRVGTIFEDSPLGLDKWICAMWLLSNAKNGISSYELGRSIGVTQRTGWFMLHRIREALRNGSIEKMKGIVEADETFVGPNADFMHQDVKKKKGIGRGFTAKTAVMGLLEHGNGKGKSKVRAKVIKNTRKKTLKENIDAHVDKGVTLHTDAWIAYQSMGSDYIHRFVDHAVRYVQDNVHTNGLENFWCLLKRTIKGTYVHVNAEHLDAYLDEQSWRYNERTLQDGGRFSVVARAIVGKRLTYKQLIGRRLAA